MNVAIIGTGKMGSGFARLLASQGVEVIIGGRDAIKAAQLAQEVGGGTRGTDIASAAKSAELIILAVYYQKLDEAIRAAGNLTGKVLIDISNPITEDFKDLLIGHRTSAAEEIQKLAPDAKVVKAYNTIFAQLLPAESREGREPVQVFVAADDYEAKRAVSDLVTKGGFEAVDAGPLSNARFLEPIGEMNIHFGFFLGWGTSAAPSWKKA
ncbi:NADPH-dependent F420 reductase [Bradyrhizobium sp. CCGB20]|uniref:NADPH-dependent F420 reductase n=1 Tax=Bradyrhizobium sp. CCGB20 TaxID=2949633 RepID=UPI0020B45AEE|nr:NADPH-dependent F420 reductase [Bradyrhizobium sp. CCGB20]MCP3402893.1 NADPH-dependent F420 reductase [Bradyrhizobium sp. CCGB20]